MKPTYSICMCNYNMARTLNRAVDSIAMQLNERFEIVLVDDGSSDDSVPQMRELAERYPMIRVVALHRDAKRKLGETRNISIRKARGEYCMLHLDCDDVWAPHLVAWVDVFHQIEDAIGVDILLAGQQVHMAKRDLLLRHGPYPNLFRSEDRAMYARFGALGILWFLEHEVFRTRLPHSKCERWSRPIVHTIDHMITDFRSGVCLRDHARFELMNAKERSTALVLVRLALLPITWVIGKCKRTILSEGSLDVHEAIGNYRNAHTSTFPDLMQMHGAVPDWSGFSPTARSIFDR